MPLFLPSAHPFLYQPRSMGAVDSRLVEKRPGGAAASHSRAGWRPAAVHIPHHLGYPPVTSTSAAPLSASFINSVSTDCFLSHLGFCGLLPLSARILPPASTTLFLLPLVPHNSSTSAPSLDLSITLSLQSFTTAKIPPGFYQTQLRYRTRTRNPLNILVPPYMSGRN